MNSYKTKNSGPEQTFFQRRHAHSQRHMKRCSPSPIIEKHTKTTKRYHLTPVRMASKKKVRNNKHWWWCGEKGTPCSVLIGMFKLVQQVWKEVWESSKIKKYNYHMIQQFLFKVFKMKPLTGKNKCTPLYCSIIYNSHNMEGI